jgi:hypothetical protein
MSKLQAINGYTLDTNVLDYPEGSLIEIHESAYEFYESFFGIKRMFKHEKFYYAGNDIFLSRKSDHALIAAINGIIYKIYYRYSDETEDDCIDFRVSVMSFLGNYIDINTLNNPIVTEVEYGKFLTWKYDWGNIILELIGYATAISLTSCVVINAKRLSNFENIASEFNKYIHGPHKK